MTIEQAVAQLADKFERLAEGGFAAAEHYPESATKHSAMGAAHAHRDDARELRALLGRAQGAAVQGGGGAGGGVLMIAVKPLSTCDACDGLPAGDRCEAHGGPEVAPVDAEAPVEWANYLTGIGTDPLVSPLPPVKRAILRGIVGPLAVVLDEGQVVEVVEEYTGHFDNEIAQPMVTIRTDKGRLYGVPRAWVQR